MEISLLNHVQSILEKYFAFLEQCNYEKAKETAEKERDYKLTNKSAVLSSFLTACSQLAVNERNYMSCNFLAPKGFLRKDNNLKSVYETLRNEFWRLKERGHITESHGSHPNLTSNSPPNSASNVSIASLSLHPGTPSSQNSSGSTLRRSVSNCDFLDNFCGHICEQLYWFATARIEMIEIYEQIAFASGQKYMLFEKTGHMLNDIIKKNGKLFHHPLLSPIKTAFTYETEALINLLNAHKDIQDGNFLRSLFNLQEAHTRLASWLSTFNSRDSSRRNSYGFVQRATPLYQWLCKVKAHLLSKQTDVSTRDEEPVLKTVNRFLPKVGAMSIKAFSRIVFFPRLSNFQRKNDGSCIALIFDTNNGEDFCGHGYKSPYSPPELLKGLHTFPPILVLPAEKEKQLHQLPSIIMIMTNRSKELNITDNIVYFFDMQIPLTYYLVRPDPRITMVFMFEGRKAEKDAYITGFIHELYTSLKGNKVFTAIKPAK